jgi:hypothetical protein
MRSSSPAGTTLAASTGPGTRRRRSMASSSVVTARLVANCIWMGSRLVRPALMTPSLSNTTTLSLFRPSARYRRRQDMAAAPAPLTTKLHFVNLLAHHFQRVQQRGRRDDGRAVLVVVHQRDVHLLAQLGFDTEALRRLDVFEVDAAERGLQRFHDADKLVGVSWHQSQCRSSRYLRIF